VGIVAALERQLSTDFALLYVEQPGTTIKQLGVYARSVPGSVGVTCGTKYAEVAVRVERWDSSPPPAADEWEDRDVLPWQSVASGALQIHGMGDDSDDGMPLDGLDRGRVEVLAQGRHRYDYGNSPLDEDGRWLLPPERWLVRLWPDPDGLDALAGPPRRLAGRQWLPQRRTGWAAAMQSWHEAGWYQALDTLPGFDRLHRALLWVGRPCRPDDLPPATGEWGWDSRLVRVPNVADPQAYVAGQRRRLEPVGAAAGMELHTYRDALTALLNLGLLATLAGAEPLYVPNPAPPAAWDTLAELTIPEGYARAAALSDYHHLADDLKHLLVWAPDGVLRTEPLAIAVRLAVPVEDVLGALRLLAARGYRVEPPDLDAVEPGTLITVERPTGSAAPR
jgi:hypothetical protein